MPKLKKAISDNSGVDHLLEETTYIIHWLSANNIKLWEEIFHCKRLGGDIRIKTRKSVTSIIFLPFVDSQES